MVFIVIFFIKHMLLKVSHRNFLIALKAWDHDIWNPDKILMKSNLFWCRLGNILKAALQKNAKSSKYPV